ncbi:MAG: tRNA (adenosine(37)-N6)-threonylcarbamoyltransferase complex dimerization subunit type 1 TsaB [Dysgonomonas sp.]
MPTILYIETATTVCSVALSVNEDVVFEQVETNGPSHATTLGVFVDNAIKFSRENNYILDAVAVSCGPGSYTGLRIGVSEAKGVCFGLNIPLIAVNTLQLMASGVVQRGLLPDEDILLCPMIDARRMEVYSAFYDKNLNIIREVRADIVDSESYTEYLDKNKVLFFGNGSEKCRDIINHKNATFLKNIYPLANEMVSLANESFNKQDFADVAYFEPFYLKEFVATTPKNKIF